MNWKIFGVKWKMILEDFGRIEKVSKNQEVLGKLRKSFRTLWEILKNCGRFWENWKNWEKILENFFETLGNFNRFQNVLKELKNAEQEFVLIKNKNPLTLPLFTSCH